MEKMMFLPLGASMPSYPVVAQQADAPGSYLLFLAKMQGMLLRADAL
jgi:hypothetical protein